MNSSERSDIPPRRRSRADSSESDAAAIRSLFIGFAVMIALGAVTLRLQKYPGLEAAMLVAERSGSLGDAFAPVLSEASKSTVLILADGRRVAYGVIVGEEGLVVTKASLLRGELDVVHDGDRLGAELVELSIDHDIALLRVDAEGREFVPVKGRIEEPKVGQWIVSTGVGHDPLAIGICSVPTRAVNSQTSASPALLGVTTNDTSFGLVVTETVEDSAAEAAGVQARDRLVSAGGITLETRADLLRVLESKVPGDALEIEVNRRGEIVMLTATLTSWPTRLRREDRWTRSLSGPLSARRSNFPKVLQHDGPLNPTHCGSPIVDIEGRVVGLNIARAERVATLALPWRVVEEFVQSVTSPRGE